MDVERKNVEAAVLEAIRVQSDPTIKREKAASRALRMIHVSNKLPAERLEMRFRTLVAVDFDGARIKAEVLQALDDAIRGVTPAVAASNAARRIVVMFNETTAQRWRAEREFLLLELRAGRDASAIAMSITRSDSGREMLAQRCRKLSRKKNEQDAQTPPAAA